MSKSVWKLFFLVTCLVLLTFQTVGAAEPVTLTMMDFFTEAVKTEGNTVAFLASLEKFKANHPDIKISEETLAQATMASKIKTLAAANELPDVFLMKGSWTSTFIDNKVIGPINRDLNKDPAWKNGFVSGAFDDFKIGANIYGVPFQMITTSLIYYNKKIFEKCGITSFPQTWNEFKATIPKLKKGGYIPIALGNKDNWVAESCILSTLGDRFTGKDWFLSIRDHKGTKFTDPNFVKSLQELQELAKLGAFNSDLNSLDNTQQRTLYYNGKAAMFFEGSWAISAIATDAPKDVLANTEVTVIPKVNGGKGNAMGCSGGSGWAWTVASNVKGKKREAAMALIKELTGANEAKLALENASQPAFKVQNYDKSKLTPLTQKYNELALKLKFVPIYDIQLQPSVIEVMNTGLQELLINAVTPQELAQKIQKEHENAK